VIDVTRDELVEYMVADRMAEIEPEIRAEIERLVRTCRGCGKLILDGRADKVHCNATCRKRAQLQRQAGLKPGRSGRHGNGARAGLPVPRTTRQSGR